MLSIASKENELNIGGSGGESLFSAAFCCSLRRLASCAPASAQQYPARPVYVSVGYAPGSSSDLFARTIGDELQARWKQPIVVENRPGSGSNVAASFVARSLPDGYNLLVATDATLTSNVFLYNSIAFDPVEDFCPGHRGGGQYHRVGSQSRSACEVGAGADRLRPRRGPMN